MSLRTLRTYTSSAEAFGDIAALESGGIPSTLKGDTQGDSNQALMGTVELQVRNEDFVAAEGIVAAAEKDRVERYTTPEQRRKTPARYLRIVAIVFAVSMAIVAVILPFYRVTVAEWLVAAFLVGLASILVGSICAILDL